MHEGWGDGGSSNLAYHIYLDFFYNIVFLTLYLTFS